MNQRQPIFMIYNKLTILALFGILNLNNTSTSSVAVFKPEVSSENILFKDSQELAKQNIQRAMDLVDLSIQHYFDRDSFEMSRFYNPFTSKKSAEKASVWMYSAAIESVNAILLALDEAKLKGHSEIYQKNYKRYVQLLDKLYTEADYYLGTFELTSFTQTRSWSVYAVDRVKEKGKANVTGVLNVYDDQMWLIRELLSSYKLTGKNAYLDKAEYLTAYVLDGWDVTLDEDGKENGGIPWGPGYTTKHACSNGPLISSLVWLHEVYTTKSVKIDRAYIDIHDKKSRLSKKVSKADYYLSFAKDIYDWQKRNLLNEDGVYTDMMGGCLPNCDIRYEEVGGVRYRANTQLTKAVGKPYSYNSGTMLSGAVDLYRVTKQDSYAKDAKSLGDNSFKYFAQLGKDLPDYYTYESRGFDNWFNGILLRGYHDLTRMDDAAKNYLQSFQRNLDYGYEHFNQMGFLPTNLLKGWGKEKDSQGVEGMFMFTFAAQYAILAEHLLND